ncbi:MAG: hypothetical protein Q7U28_01460 [Aquabacterium sp.]|nr:hypothetical protein [Aquabacterium sp.]
MTTNNVATYLAFANLQMAAEADLQNLIGADAKGPHSLHVQGVL